MSNSVNLSLDVTKTGIQNPLIKVRQGDGGFETLHTTVTSNGEPLDLQGWTITFMGTTAGNHKIVDGNVNIVEAPNGIFDYTPSKAWGMDIGDFKMAYFKFVKGDGSASSANFRVSVIEAVDLTQDEAKNYISVVDATIADVRQRLTNSLASVTASVAATSSAVSSLAVSASNVATSAVNKVNVTASSAVSQVNSAASNASSVASSAVSQVNSAAGVYVKKSGDTMTGALTVGGDPTQGGSGTTIKQNGNIELGAPTAFIDFHGQNSTQDYTSRIYDDTTFAGVKVTNSNSGNGASALLNTLALSSNRSFNLDTLVLTVDGVNYGLASSDVNIAISNRSQVTAPTLPADMAAFEIDRGMISYHVGPTSGWTYMEMTNLWTNTTWKRTKRDGAWQPWIKIANDYNVVHNTGNETVAGDKTLTGNTTLANIKSSNVKTGSVALNGLTLDFRQTVVGVNVYMHGSFTGTFGTDQSYTTSSSVIPSNIDNPKQTVVLAIVSNGGVSGITNNSPWELEVLLTSSGAIQYRAKNLRDNDITARNTSIVGADSAFYTIE